MTFDDYMALMANVNITVSSYDPGRQISKLIISCSGGISSGRCSIIVLMVGVGTDLAYRSPSRQVKAIVQ